MQVVPLRYHDDNYCYFVKHKVDSGYSVVDPGDSERIANFIIENNIKIDRILITHKHWDHIGEIDWFYDSIEKYMQSKHGLQGKLPLFAGKNDNVPKTNVFCGIDEQGKHVKENSWKLSPEVSMRAFSTPCHTIGHTLFYLEDLQNSSNTLENGTSWQGLPEFTQRAVVFTGDTFFIGGVGKFFEGNGDQMQTNLEAILQLPGDTCMYPGHDYTEANLKWAEGIEWENSEYMSQQQKWQQRKEQNPSLAKYQVPSTQLQEKQSNIFFRTLVPELQKKLGVNSASQCMAVLREMKDKKVSLKSNM